MNVHGKDLKKDKEKLFRVEFGEWRVLSGERTISALI